MYRLNMPLPSAMETPLFMDDFPSYALPLKSGMGTEAITSYSLIYNPHEYNSHKYHKP